MRSTVRSFVGECETGNRIAFFQEQRRHFTFVRVTSRDNVEGAVSSVARKAMVRAPNERAVLLTVIFAIASLIIRGPLCHQLSAFSSWYMTRLHASPLLTKCITRGIVTLSTW